MQNCPTCQMLMDDHEVVCASCAAESALGGPLSSTHTASGAAAGSATAVLERPASVPMPQTVRYRSPGEHRRRGVVVVLVLVLVAAIAGLVVMGLRGEGPLARTVVEAGLVAPPVVSVPDAWSTVASDDGAFRLAMPRGATELSEVVDAANPAAGSTYGYEVQLGEGGSAAVVSSDFGMAPADIMAIDDPARFDGMVDAMVAGMIGPGGTSRETVRRDVPVGNGRAADLVVVDEATASTARVRILLADGRMYMVMTSGSDEGADRLDEVHARLLDTFETTA